MRRGREGDQPNLSCSRHRYWQWQCRPSRISYVCEHGRDLDVASFLAGCGASWVNPSGSLRTACLILAAVSPSGTLSMERYWEESKESWRGELWGGRRGVLCDEATNGRASYQSGRRRTSSWTGLRRRERDSWWVHSEHMQHRQSHN